MERVAQEARPVAWYCCAVSGTTWHWSTGRWICSWHEYRLASVCGTHRNITMVHH